MDGCRYIADPEVYENFSHRRQLKMIKWKTRNQEINNFAKLICYDYMQTSRKYWRFPDLLALYLSNYFLFVLCF